MKQYKNNKNQRIGQLHEGIFRKRVKKEVHFMKILKSYGIEETVIQDMKDKCKEIRILEDGKTVYTCSMETMLDKGFIRNFGTEQRFLVIKEFTTYDTKR